MAVADKKYDLAGFNCRDGADAILNQCGLTRYSGQMYKNLLRKDEKYRRREIYDPNAPGPKW
jgi:hypothetical protein